MTSGHFSFWISLSLRPTKDWDQTAQLWSQSGVETNQSPRCIVADVVGDSSLILPYFFVYFELAKKWSNFCSSKLSQNITNILAALSVCVSMSLVSLRNVVVMVRHSLTYKRTAILQKERRRGAHLPFIGRWARRSINHYCLWCTASATPGLRLLSQPKLVLTAPTHGGMARLHWPGWLVT